MSLNFEQIPILHILVPAEKFARFETLQGNSLDLHQINRGCANHVKNTNRRTSDTS